MAGTWPLHLIVFDGTLPVTANLDLEVILSFIMPSQTAAIIAGKFVGFEGTGRFAEFLLRSSLLAGLIVGLDPAR
jgi:hypothetical protein